MLDECLIGHQLIILLLLTRLVWLRYHKAIQRWWEELNRKPKRSYQRHPRTPYDCVDCCIEHAFGPPLSYTLPIPWSQVKSPRGRPKTYDSQDHACVNPDCPYYLITDASIHALRHNGNRNKVETAGQWECACCLESRTERVGTVQYRLKTHSDTVSLAIHLHMKNMAAADISEVIGKSPATIQRWLDRGGQQSEKLHQSLFKDIISHHIQLDELVTKVRSRVKHVWIWTAIDVQTRLWVVWLVGDRTQAHANRLLHRLERRLSRLVIPIFTSDGMNKYYYAITPHWGFWTVVKGKRKPVWNVDPNLLYGQLKKTTSRFKLKHIATRMLCGTRDDMTNRLQQLGLTGSIQTAYVERLNLTLRHIIPALRRRTWAIAHSIQTLRWRVALAATYYNFCRPHQSLPGKGRQHLTPAMAAGITDHRWTVKEFVLHPVY